MCGIVGHASGRGAVSADLLKGMRDAMRHRGPDGSGIWRSSCGNVAFGHLRLAIIDLTEGGHQPMTRGSVTVTYNGEIYNYRELRAELEELGHSFTSASDTEVLLASYRQWGQRCVERLEGMFAFVLYDADRNALFAARDRAGEKPLFYRHDQTGLWFGSELKALLAHPDAPRRIDPAGLDEYLAYGYVASDRCILGGYRKLPPAHCLSFEVGTGALQIKQYWAPPHYSESIASDNEIIEELGIRLERSVQRQLVADVPVGVLLSGGLDSSLVAAAAARSGRSIKTYTIVNPGSRKHDESVFARQIADHFGTDHRELQSEALGAGDLDALIYQYDEPLADSSMVPTHMVSRLIRRECTVALGGDGGDELFGGYLHYPYLGKIAAMHKFGIGNLGLDRPLSSLMPFGTRGRSPLLALMSRRLPDVTLTRMMDPHVRATLLGCPSNERAEINRETVVADRRDLPERFLALDFQTYMPDDILVKVDRASMLASLEVRAPMLDASVVDFAFSSVPGRLKTHDGGRKLALRALAKQWLPENFDAVRKQGFSIPIAEWLNGPWAPYIQELRDTGSPFFQRDALGRFLDRMLLNDRGANRVFQLLVLEKWRQAYRVSF